MIAVSDYIKTITEYLPGKSVIPLFLLGDSLTVLQEFPDECIDFCMTSPPYWGKRQYGNGGIGLEECYGDFIDGLLSVFKEMGSMLILVEI